MATTSPTKPRDLILHEAIKSILDDMQDLRSQVVGLRAENLALKERVNAVEYPQTLALDANGNGEVKYTKEIADRIAGDAKRHRETADNHSNQIFSLDTRTQSLKKDQVQMDDNHDKQFDTLRDRVRNLEHTREGMVERKDFAFYQASTDRNTSGMAEFRAEFDDIRGETTALKLSVKQVEEAVNGVAFQHHAPAYQITERFTEREKTDAGSGMTLREEIKSRQTQEHTIDDCYHRETLIGYWDDLTKAASSGTRRCAAGLFRGSLNDMWALQNRALRRLATLDALRYEDQSLKRRAGN